MKLLEEHYKVNRTKTLITGYSMGGIACWYMAARHQDLFKAAIPISAAPTKDASEMAWNIPLYVIHSRKDEDLSIRRYANQLSNDCGREEHELSCTLCPAMDRK